MSHGTTDEAPLQVLQIQLTPLVWLLGVQLDSAASVLAGSDIRGERLRLLSRADLTLLLLSHD